MDNYDMFVPKVHFELIPIKNLVSNQEYQRNLSVPHIKKAASDFDLYQINPVKVSRRNGINYVFDGQHTTEIVAMVSGSRETPVWCMVYDDLCYEEEAGIFANQSEYVRPLTPYDKFIGNIESGSDEELVIKELVESFGLMIDAKPGRNKICAVSTVQSIFRKYGYHTLRRVLKLCVATWEGDMHSFSANIMNAITRLIITYGDDLNDEIFKEKLGMVSLKYLARTAKERNIGALGFAEAMVIEYNGKTKNPKLRLKMDRLHMRVISQLLDAENIPVSVDIENIEE